MKSLSQLADDLTFAYNQKSNEGMTALLAEDATAEVIGSGFPVEVGPDVISKTSFPHILDEVESPLSAEAHEIDGVPVIVLRRKSDGLVDMLMKLKDKSGLIGRIDYLVVHFRRDEMVEMVTPLGLEVCSAN